MADYLVTIPPSQPEPPPQTYRWVLYFVLTICLFFGSKYAYDRYTHALIPPLGAQKAGYLYVLPNEDTPATEIHAGQGFFIRTFTNRIEICTVESQYSIMEFKEVDQKTLRKVWYAYPLSKNRSLKGETITDKYLVVPDWLPPGNYMITRQSEYDCNGQHISQDGPPLPFTISGG